MNHRKIIKWSVGLVICALCILLIVIIRPRWFIVTYYQLCPRRFYPLSDFPELSNITANFAAIRAECLAVMDAPLHQIYRAQSVWTHGDLQQTLKYVNDTRELYGWQPAWSPGVTTVNNKWINMPFIVNATQNDPVLYEKNLSACPQLAKMLIEKKDIIHVAGFSRLRSGMRIAQHTDTTGLRYGSAAYHLGLIVPDPSLCSMTVDGAKIYQREGQAFIFESTRIHHASNWSDGDRVILYIDFKVI